MAERGQIRRYRFGDFVVDERRCALQRNGEDLPLRRKSWEVLRELVMHPGELLTKETLLEAVWRDRVVTEGVVAKSVREIRQVLGDGDRSVVRLVPRRGYRFDGIVTVEVIDEDMPGAAPDPAPPLRVTRLSRPVAMAAVLLAALAVVFGVAHEPFDSSSRGADGGRPGPSARSIAVLPFDDMSPDGDHQFLADGMAEEILNFLSMNQDLTVIARTSSFAFQGESVDAVTVGRRLNVAYVLEGSLRRSGDQLRVAVQLIDVGDGSRVWSASYDRQLGDSLELQTEIARAVSEKLHVRFADSGQRRPVDPVAYQHYLEARFRFNRRIGDDLLLAEELFVEATRIDPGFARAWAGLAGVYWVRTDPYTDDWIRLSMPQALEAMALPIERALQADPDLAEAHVRACLYFSNVGQPDRASDHLARAQALAPNDPLVLASFGWYPEDPLSVEREIDLQRRIVAVDPLSLVARSNLVGFLIKDRRLDEARRELDEALSLHPAAAADVAELWATVELLDGNIEAAVAAIETMPDDGSLPFLKTALLAMASQGRGLSDRSVEALARLEQAPGEWAALRIAEIHAYAGAEQKTFAWLHEALQRTGPDTFGCRALWIEVDSSPFLSELKDDPRWHALGQQFDLCSATADRSG
jgi:TolB-like protein/DNA-binding winged helix-turn-helix (wHTH) protein/Flp pilus assembly protein TadD